MENRPDSAPEISPHTAPVRGLPETFRFFCTNMKYRASRVKNTPKAIPSSRRSALPAMGMTRAEARAKQGRGVITSRRRRCPW